MNHQLPPPVPANAFQKAIQKYVKEGLLDSDKAAFLDAPNVMDHLQEIQRNGKSVISSSLTCRVEKVLQGVKSFMGSLAIFIQQHPEISSLVVGGVSCVLTLVLGYIEFFERLTLMMENIGNHLSYLSEYSKPTFQESEKLQEKLAAAYCDLLEFYVKARQAFINKKGRSSYVQGFKLFFKLIWEPFEAQFSSIEARFSNHTIAVVRLADVDHQTRTLEYQKREDNIRVLEKEKKEKEEAIEMRRKILEWLSLDDFDETHERHFQKRFKNTGQWLLEDSRFKNWRDEAKSGLLWCYGAPGSGKTILASMVTEHLSARYQLSTTAGITFVYCNYKEFRTTNLYIRMALKQLCRTMQSLPLELQKVYNHHYSNHSQPKYEELRTVFLAFIRHFGHIFFVLDALDECTLDQRKGLCDFMLSLANSTGQGIIKLFVTSRRESDIELAFRQKFIPIIEVDAAKVNSDIEVYVKAQIELRYNLKHKNVELKKKIFNALTTKAGGMFLWVEFQLDAICEEASDKGIEKALERVPDDLNATYERILKTIDEKRRPKRELARKILAWVAYARRPLSVYELAYATSIETDTKGLNDLKSSIPTEEFIVDACANLVSVDRSNQKSRYVRFVHFSVQEFFTRNRSTTLNLGYEMAHWEIAQTCIILLPLSPKQSDSRDMLHSNDGAIRSLFKYVSKEWPHHLLAANLNSLPVNDHRVVFISSFLEKSPTMQTTLPTDLDGYWENITVDFMFSPAVLALIFDLPGTGKCGPLSGGLEEAVVYDRGRGRVLVLDDKLVIHYATAELDSVPVVRRLYNYGYNLNYSLSSLVRKVSDYLQLPALFSVRSTEMARYLVNNGISIEPKNLQGVIKDPLAYFAARQNQIEVFQFLLDRVVGQGDERLTRAMEAAYEANCLEAIRLLADKILDFNFSITVRLSKGGRSYIPVLQAAVCQSRLEVVQLLLDKGANVYAQSGVYSNALQGAVCDGIIEVIQLLLDKGVDVNVQGGKHGNALQAAAYWGRVEVVQLLLDKGADVNAQGGSYSNALQAAACKGTETVIQLLLDKGANVNAQGGIFGNALQAAIDYGDTEVVHLLLNNGANVSAQGGIFGNALQAAIVCDRIGVEVIQLLLDKEADVNAQGGIFGNALQAAMSSEAEAEVVQLLLDNGVDVNAQGGMFGNALQAAMLWNKGEVEVVQLLLDKGADVNAQGGMFGTVLQAAAYSGNTEGIRIALDNGANIYDRFGKYGAVLGSMVALEPVGTGQKVPGDIPLLTELLQEHAPIDAEEFLEERGFMEDLVNENRCHLDGFRELLEERGWKRGVQDSKKEGLSRLETERELGENERGGGIEDEVDYGGKAGNEACDEASLEVPDIGSQEEGDVSEGEIEHGNKDTLLDTPIQRSLKATLHAWKLLGFALLVFLLYTFIEFWGV